MKKCGYIALVGRPNAGKSTLLNALIGQKLAVVSKKPQTTRNRILGVLTEGETQLIFLDTPGIHRGQGKLLNATMNRVAHQTAGEADLIVYVVDVTWGWKDEDTQFLGRIVKNTKAPIIVLASKVDAAKQFIVRDQLEKIDEAIEPFRERLLYDEALATSAKRPEEVAALKQLLTAHLPEGDWLFAGDDLTDMPNNFVCAELIREQVFRQLGQEIPYGTAVRLDSMEEKPGITVLYATILVERDSHKGIVVGKQGARIKEIGSEARASLERHLGTKVFLDLSVKVAAGWTDDQRLINELAHLQDLDTDLSGPV